MVQDHFLNAYECYLLRRYFDPKTSFRTKQQIKEKHLTEFYRFLAALEGNPYIKDTTDATILYNIDDDRFLQCNADEFKIEESFLPFFNKVRDNTTIGGINTLYKQLKDIFRRNSKKNLEELNKNVISLIHFDTNNAINK